MTGSGEETTDDREYAAPVDPWADHSPPHAPEPPSSWSGGETPPRTDTVPPHASTAPLPTETAPTAPAHPPYRKKSRRLLIAGAAAVVVLLGAGAALTYAYWPGVSAIDFRQLSAPQHIAPAIPLGANFAVAEVYAGRVYYGGASPDAAAEDQEKLGVVAVEADTGKKLWSSTAAGSAATWDRMVALPVGLAVFTEVDSATAKRRVAVLGADDGELLWQRDFGRDDDIIFSGDTALLADTTGHRLVGLGLDDGKEKWSLADTEPDAAKPILAPVTTPADLNGPARLDGRASEPDLADDPRVVQLSPDKSARVIDADSGKVLSTRQNVGGSSVEAVAHNGRLIVRQDDKRVVTYQLDKMGEPTVLYTPQAGDVQIEALTPCGDDRVCFIEETGYKSESATVVALDAQKGTEVWRRATPKDEKLVPVGEAVIAWAGEPNRISHTTLINASGALVWSSTGAAARLDSGNVLEFSTLGPGLSDPDFSGRYLGDDAVPLGMLSRVHAVTCSWNTTVLACASEEDFTLQSFAG